MFEVHPVYLENIYSNWLKYLSQIWTIFYYSEYLRIFNAAIILCIILIIKNLYLNFFIPKIYIFKFNTKNRIIYWNRGDILLNIFWKWDKAENVWKMDTLKITCSSCNLLKAEKKHSFEPKNFKRHFQNFW